MELTNQIRLEQFPAFKQLIEQKMTDILQTGRTPTKLRYNITSFPGEARIQININVDFKSMRHPSDPECSLSLEELAGMVTGSLSIQGEIIPELWEKKELEGRIDIE